MWSKWFDTYEERTPMVVEVMMWDKVEDYVVEHGWIYEGIGVVEYPDPNYESQIRTLPEG